MLPISDVVSGWTFVAFIIAALVLARREIVKLLLGRALIKRSRQSDLPEIAKALYGADAEPTEDPRKSNPAA